MTSIKNTTANNNTTHNNTAIGASTICLAATHTPTLYILELGCA